MAGKSSEVPRIVDISFIYLIYFVYVLLYNCKMCLLTEIMDYPIWSSQHLISFI